MKRKAIALLLCLVLATTAVSMLTACTQKEPDVSAKDTVAAFLDAFKAGDIKKMDSYLNTSGDSAKEFASEAGMDQATADKFLSAFGKNLQYNIISDDENLKAGTATVEVEVTNTSFAQLVKDATASLTKKMMSDPSLATGSTDDTQKLTYDEMLSAFDTTKDTKTSKVDVKLVIVDGVWKINDDAIINPMFGDILGAASGAAN